MKVPSGVAPSVLFDLLLAEWHLPAPNLVVSLVGEERPFAMKSWLRDVLRKGLVRAAQSTGEGLPGPPPPSCPADVPLPRTAAPHALQVAGLWWEPLVGGHAGEAQAFPSWCPFTVGRAPPPQLPPPLVGPTGHSVMPGCHSPEPVHPGASRVGSVPLPSLGGMWVARCWGQSRATGLPYVASFAIRQPRRRTGVAAAATAAERTDVHRQTAAVVLAQPRQRTEPCLLCSGKASGGGGVPVCTLQARVAGLLLLGHLETWALRPGSKQQRLWAGAPRPQLPHQCLKAA